MKASLVLAAVLGLAAAGCGWGKQAEACGRLAGALEMPPPPRSRSAKPGELQAAARAYAAAGVRVSGVKNLPPDLAAITDPARLQLSIAAEGLEAAAAARRSTHAPNYATARQRVDAARRALSELSKRFDDACAR